MIIKRVKINRGFKLYISVFCTMERSFYPPPKNKNYDKKGEFFKNKNYDKKG